MAHIVTIIPETTPICIPLQMMQSLLHFHTALSHLDKRNTYVRIDYCLAYTIVLSMLITKLRTLGLKSSLCNWILDFDGPPPGDKGR
jgi:hypothetical protein